MMVEFWALVLAFLLDWCFGEPPAGIHPVRWIGYGIERLESFARRSRLDNRLFGWTLAVVFPGVVGLSVFLLTGTIRGGSIEMVLMAFFLWSLISYQGMRDHVDEVYRELTQENLGQARRKVSRIVGRNTDSMDKSEISKACIESTAEGFVDGFLSPLFWFLVGGLPLAVAYKTVNTMDSMIGYKNSRYRRIGEGAARIDDVMNWIPARLSLLFITAGSVLVGLPPVNTLRIGLRDRLNHESPNAAHAESAFAGALDRQLGGPVQYGDRYSERKYLHQHGGEVSVGDIQRSLRLYRAVTMLTVLVALVIVWGST